MGREKRYVQHNFNSHNSMETADLREAIVNYKIARRLHRIQFNKSKTDTTRGLIDRTECIKLVKKPNIK